MVDVEMCQPYPTHPHPVGQELTGFCLCTYAHVSIRFVWPSNDCHEEEYIMKA